MSAKTKLEILKEQKAKLEVRIQMAEAREKTKERQNDTRRKILIGAYYIDKAEKDKSMDEIRKVLDGYLTREKDRILFGLPAKKNNN